MPGAKLGQVWDPRDRLQKVRRKPLEIFMKKQFPSLFEPGMPADLMRMILRQKGIYEIPQQVAVVEEPPSEPESVNALDILRQDWEARLEPDYSAMSIGQLRTLCKQQGFKLKNTDKKVDMVRMLNGEDASERGQ